MKSKKKIILIVTSLIALLLLSGFKINIPFFNKENEDSSEKTKEVKIDTHFKVNSNVSYSSGSDSNWSYGNQRKEFPRDEACYVRATSVVITEKNKGVGTEITITYTFTGAKNCKIELSDGIAKKENSDDPNVQVYTRTVSAEKEKKASESLVIFQYTPYEEAENMVLEITYDDHVPEKYDVRNTIYFSDY